MSCPYCEQTRAKAWALALRTQAWLDRHINAQAPTDPQAQGVEASGALEQAGPSAAADGQTVAQAQGPDPQA